MVFVDTNVLVYARDISEPEKLRRAIEWMASLWKSRRGRLSFQVLQEYYVTVTRKLSPGLEPGAARSDVRNLLSWQPIRTNSIVIEGAWSLQDRYDLAWWDALIVSAARTGHCEILLTEDFQDGQSLGSVKVVNPFLHEPEAV